MEIIDNLVKELQLGDREYCSYIIVEYGCFLTLSTISSSDVMEEDAILVSTSTREPWNEYFVHYIPCLSISSDFLRRRLCCVCVEVVRTSVHLCLLVLALACEPAFCKLWSVLRPSADGCDQFL